MSRVHPSPSAYQGGCRCAECRELHRVRCAATRARLAARPRADVPHGTDGGYVNWRCRCPWCRRANADRQAWRKARRASP